MATVTALMTTLTFVMSACGSGGGEGGSEAGPGDDVVVAAGGGDYRDLQEQYVVAEMAQCSSEVMWDYTEDDAKMTKVRTEAQGAGTLDVIELPNDRMQQLVEADAMLALDTSNVPNIANVRPGLENEHWVPHVYSASVIIYNEDRVDPAAAESYNVLWDPAYSGRIGVLSTQWSNLMYAAAAVASNGANNGDWNAGWTKLEELKDRVVVFSSQEELGQALMSEQVWLTVNWKARALQWNELGGVPLGVSVAREGTFPIVFVAGVAANGPNQQCALDFVNSLLDPDAQLAFAENMGYAPTVTNVTLDPERAAQLDFTPEEQQRIKELDLSYVVENDAEWGQMWQQEFIN